MLLKQYYLGCLTHASYLMADEAIGTAVIVDPQRDIDPYLTDAAHLGLDIRYVFLTHFHADFLAGHVELRQRVGVTMTASQVVSQAGQPCWQDDRTCCVVSSA